MSFYCHQACAFLTRRSSLFSLCRSLASSQYRWASLQLNLIFIALANHSLRIRSYARKRVAVLGKISQKKCVSSYLWAIPIFHTRKRQRKSVNWCAKMWGTSKKYSRSISTMLNKKSNYRLAADPFEQWSFIDQNFCILLYVLSTFTNRWNSNGVRCTIKNEMITIIWSSGSVIQEGWTSWWKLKLARHEGVPKCL